MTGCIELRSFIGALSLFLIAAFASAAVCQDGEIKDGRLTHVESIAREDLAAINHVNLSDDGKFIYTTSWEAKAVNVFRRDEKTGRANHVQTLASDRDLDGVTSFCLSPDGRLGAASAFRSQTVTLFSRDAESGRLKLLDSARDSERGVKGLVWAIDLTFSTDGKFIYALDPKGSGVTNPLQQGNLGGVTAFEVRENDRLRWLENNAGEDDCFNGARGIAAHPRGKWLYVASSNAACVVAAERDAKTGKLRVLQVVKDDQGEVSGLDGAMTPLVSPDGKFLYVNSGRFHGDSGVIAFRIGDDGKLAFLEEHLGATGQVKNYVGGNTLALAPDGRNLYAAATRSGTLACFSRDPETGKLTYQETIADDAGRGELGGAAGVAVSPDGRFAYVTAEYDNALSVYERK
ncbi:MAG: lactonase family protein [Planctomycetes bacterium]|nr:lactonase family protein [Planctomycetota bacterium]